MTDDQRPISIIGSARIGRPASIAMLRQLAEAALNGPVGEVTVDDAGVHRVNSLPHDVAAELLKRIDDGATVEELGRWMVGRLGADREDD
jgi:hypothetical protein